MGNIKNFQPMKEISVGTSIHGHEVENGFLFVTDGTNGSSTISKIDSSETLFTIGNLEIGLIDPYSITIVKDLLFVTDSLTKLIYVLRKRDLRFVNSLDFSLLRPKGITNDGEFLYIVDSSANTIVKVRLSDGTIVASGGGLGSGVGQMAQPDQIAWDSLNNALYIADLGNDRIVKWDTDLNEIGVIPQSASIDGVFGNPRGVSVANHYVYVLEGGRLQVFDTATLTRVASIGSQSPADINRIQSGYHIIARDNKIYIGDEDSDSVKIWFNYEPERDFAFLQDRVVHPSHLEIDRKQLGENLRIDGLSPSNKIFFTTDERQKNGNFIWSKK